MKTQKRRHTFFIVLIAGFLMTSCFSEDNFLTDNLEETGRSFPTITDITILNSESDFVEGDVIQLDVRFWSDDPVDEIILFRQLNDQDGNVLQPEEVVSSVPYSQATFSEESQTDFVILEYTVPEIFTDPTIINFVIEVVNENGLTEVNTDAKNPTIRNISVTAVQ